MKQNRFWLMAGVFAAIIFIIGFIVAANGSKSTVQDKAASGAGGSEIPWDYRVTEGKVGDLLDGDMLLLPNNERISNDQNFATGDQVWVLNYMNASMKTDAEGRNDVTLSQWKPIKTFKTKEDAEKDLSELKKEVKTTVDLVGVYKTELDGKYRYFAVADLPTGQKVKQPIGEDRYTSLKDKKQVDVILEEVHDYGDYDQAMAKFRGWAD